MALWQATQRARHALEATTLNMHSVAVRLEVPAHKTGERQVSTSFGCTHTLARALNPRPPLLRGRCSCLLPAADRPSRAGPASSPNCTGRLVLLLRTALWGFSADTVSPWL